MEEMEDNRQTMELQMPVTSQQANDGSTSFGQRSSFTTADSASISSGVGSIAPPDPNDAGDSGSHLIMIENLDATNGIHHGAAPIIPITPNSEITPASNNSPGQSSDPNDEDLETQQGATLTPASNNSAGTSQGQSPNPNEDLESLERAQKTLDDYLPLRQAASKGDWRAAKKFYDRHNDCVGAFITTRKATALHVAVAYQKTPFIKKWLRLTTRTADLELKTDGFTALHTAARVGNVSIAEQLVKKYPGLLSITNDQQDIPLIVAAYIGHRNMVSYLFRESIRSTHPVDLTPEKRIELLSHTIRNDMYDIALEILENLDIANADANWKWEELETLSKKRFSIVSERELSFWKSLSKYSCFKGIYNNALMKASAHQLVERLLRNGGNPDALILSNFAKNNMALIFEAAKAGNVEFLIIISRFYPDVIWELDQNRMSIFHIAILHRQGSVFNLIYEIGADMRSLALHVTEDNNENALHLAGKLAPSDRLNIVSGAALQMQQELLWFKEIEKIVPQLFLTYKDKSGKTPKEIFVEEHKYLQKDGENWMRNTANYCMVVATLIATVMFAAAFTVPGGSDENKGTPIFLRRNWFMVFFISDVIALCSSSTSIVIFLSILTSRYREDDFFKSLPLKLLFGLATLFISMTGMMVAFIANFSLVYTRASTWPLFVVLILIILFARLHCKIWVDTFHSTFRTRFLFGPHKHRLL